MDIEEIIKDKIAQAEPRWIAQGITQGIAQGERNKAVATAKKALECNIPRDIIANITGLTVTEVAAL